MTTVTPVAYGVFLFAARATDKCWKLRGLDEEQKLAVLYLLRVLVLKRCTVKSRENGARKFILMILLLNVLGDFDFGSASYLYANKVK